MPINSSKRLKINKSSVEKIPDSLPGKPVFYWFEEPTGFGLRVSGSVKSYIFQDRVNGKKVRVKIGRHGNITVDEAYKEAKKLASKTSHGINPQEEKAAERIRSITLDELLPPYITARKLRPSTVEIYDGALRRCFSDWLKTPITEITKDMVQKRHEEISNRNSRRGKGEAHANQAMRVLQSLLNYASTVYEDAQGRPLLTENPVKRLSQAKLWNRINRRTDFIQKADLEAWFAGVATLENHTTRDFLLVCLFTGMRRNEVAKLKWTDINFKSKLLTIPSNRTKNHDEHKLPLSDYLEEILLRRNAENQTGQKSEYVFPGASHGSSPHIVEVKASVKMVVDRSKVKFTVHGLRRTFLTIGESLDVPHYTLKRLANHRVNGDVTGGYIQLTVDRLRDPMQRITDTILEHAKVKNP